MKVIVLFRQHWSLHLDVVMDEAVIWSLLARGFLKAVTDIISHTFIHSYEVSHSATLFLLGFRITVVILCGAALGNELSPICAEDKFPHSSF